MKLNDMGKPSAKKINKFMESRFGFSIDYNKMTISRAVKLSETIDANLYKIRHSVALHTAERNPQYMELVTVRENLHNWLMSRHRQLNEGEIATVVFSTDILELYVNTLNLELNDLVKSLEDF